MLRINHPTLTCRTVSPDDGHDCEGRARIVVLCTLRDALPLCDPHPAPLGVHLHARLVKLDDLPGRDVAQPVDSDGAVRCRKGVHARVEELHVVC